MPKSSTFDGIALSDVPTKNCEGNLTCKNMNKELFFQYKKLTLNIIYSFETVKKFDLATLLGTKLY